MYPFIVKQFIKAHSLQESGALIVYCDSLQWKNHTFPTNSGWRALPLAY